MCEFQRTQVFASLYFKSIHPEPLITHISEKGDKMRREFNSCDSFSENRIMLESAPPLRKS